MADEQSEVVDVHLLGRLAGQQVDRQVGREQGVGLEDLVEDRHHPRVLDELGDRRCLGQERVDAVGLEALEVVAPPVGVRPEPGRQPGADAS